MTLEEMLVKYPEAAPYFDTMPEELKSRYTIRTFPPGYIIHQKDFILNYFGIIVHGDHRVINEFENGNVFMIEKNEAVDFIGEVAILAGQEKTSVTIETLTECVAFMISRADFESWIAKDNRFLRMIAQKVAFKLYRSSYNRGSKLFYPPNQLLLDYLLKYVFAESMKSGYPVIVKQTRQELYEELGMTVKTINRTISKLKDAGLIDIRKGKMCMSEAQFEKGKEELRRLNGQ